MALGQMYEVDRIDEIIPLHAAETAHSAADTLPSPEGLYKSVPTHLINRFGQQRDGGNEVQGELDKSIERLGVLEPVLVAVMSDQELASYIEFTNKTWGVTVRLEDCIPFAASLGGESLYLALIGGHSRVGSVEQLALSAGQILDDSVCIDARILPVDSAVDYAVKQAAENIHSRPSPYRTIRLVASAYLFRTAQGEAVTRRAFAQEMGVSEETLRDALNYAELPDEVRDYTDKGVLPIGVSVELARALPAFRRECECRISKKYGYSSKDDWTEEASREFDKLLHLELLRHITAHNNSTNKGRITVTRAQIRMHAQHVRAKIGGRLADSPDLEMNLFDARDYLDMDLETRNTALRDEIERNLRDFQSERSIAARRLHNLACLALGFEDHAVDETQVRGGVDLGATALTLVV